MNLRTNLLDEDWPARDDKLPAVKALVTFFGHKATTRNLIDLWVRMPKVFQRNWKDTMARGYPHRVTGVRIVGLVFERERYIQFLGCPKLEKWLICYNRQTWAYARAWVRHKSE